MKRDTSSLRVGAPSYLEGKHKESVVVINVLFVMFVMYVYCSYVRVICLYVCVIVLRANRKSSEASPDVWRDPSRADPRAPR